MYQNTWLTQIFTPRPMEPSQNPQPLGRHPPPLYTRDSLTHIECYMDGVISAVQGRTKLQQLSL